MKRFLISLKHLSRTVHNDHDDEEHDVQDQRLRWADHGNDVLATTNCYTVWRKSLLINCNGFTVIDSLGDLIYRVDNYIGRPQEIVLMDGSGNSILTMRRKKFGLVDSWLVYEGEIGDHQYYYKRTRSSKSKRPVFCVRKSINLLINAKPNNVLAYIYRDTSNKRCIYTVEGSYTNRSCKVLEYDCPTKVVAETRMKEEIVGGVCYGVDVFQLIVRPGFDSAFAMALVLLLDQMFT